MFLLYEYSLVMEAVILTSTMGFFVFSGQQLNSTSSLQVIIDVINYSTFYLAKVSFMNL